MSFHNVNTSRLSDEWYTPECVWRKVQDFFGVISLDPCSNSHDRPNVPAQNVYTKEDDGLSKEWYGKVFVNPPYSKVKVWTEKLVSEVDSGRTIEACLFPKVDTSTRWFDLIFRKAAAILFYKRRLQFANSGKVAPFASCLAYFGPRPHEFKLQFREEGNVILL